MDIQKEFMERLKDVEMDVTVRFGSTDLPLRDVAALGAGSMIELNRTVDEPVELLVNNCPFARGEVVVVDGYYSVRVTEVSPPEKSPNTFLAGAIKTDDEAPAPQDTAPSKPSPPPKPQKPKTDAKPPQAKPALQKPQQQNKPAPPKKENPGDK